MNVPVNFFNFLSNNIFQESTYNYELWKLLIIQTVFKFICVTLMHYVNSDNFASNSSGDTDDHKVQAVLQVLIWWEVVEIEVEEGSINRF